MGLLSSTRADTANFPRASPRAPKRRCSYLTLEQVALALSRGELLARAGAPGTPAPGKEATPYRAVTLPVPSKKQHICVSPLPATSR